MQAAETIFDKLIYVFIGAVVTWLFQQYRITKAEEVALVNEHIKDLEKFSDAAQNYWLKSPVDPNEELALAARVRAAHAATTRAYTPMIHACGRRGEEYKSLSLKVFSTATGGAFEGKSRTIDAPRAIEIHDQVAELIHLLRTCRKELLSLKRFLYSISSYRIDFER